MKKNYKQSVMDAITRHHEKQLSELQPKKTRAKYDKPEKEVEKNCLTLMRSWGWSVNIFEAKATYDPRLKIYRNQAMKAGVCDCMGSTNEGVAVAIEFKAPGAISTFNSIKRTKQREFIINKIMSNCFACVVDSAEVLEDIYTKWKNIRSVDINNAKEFLLSRLPKKRSVKSSADDKFDLDF